MTIYVMRDNPKLFHQAKSVEEKISRKDKYWQKAIEKILRKDNY